MGEVTADRIARYQERIGAPDATCEELCARVADGESLQEVCAAWDVPYSRIAAWLGSDKARMAQYLGALRMRADSLAAECVAIADGAGEPADRKVRIDTRLRLAAKWDRARYGEHAQIDVTDKPTGEMPALEVARRVAFLFAQGTQQSAQHRVPRLIEAQAQASESLEDSGEI